MNVFPVKCRTCGAAVLMDQDAVTKKWRPMDEKDGQLVPHWPTCEENQRERRKNEETEQTRLDLAYRAGRRQDARQRQENMRALVKGTALEKPQPMTRQVKASDGFIDELPWSEA